MEKVLLDTDIFSEVLKRKDATVADRAAEYLLEHGRLTTTVLTVLEVVSGWHRLQREDRVQEFLSWLPSFEILPFEADAAAQAGRIEADLFRTGRPVGRADSMIAGIAIVRGLPLVTGNTEHYSRIVELGFPLTVTNWRAR